MASRLNGLRSKSNVRQYPSMLKACAPELATLYGVPFVSWKQCSICDVFIFFYATYIPNLSQNERQTGERRKRKKTLAKPENHWSKLAGDLRVAVLTISFHVTSRLARKLQSREITRFEQTSTFSRRPQPPLLSPNTHLNHLPGCSRG